MLIRFKREKNNNNLTIEQLAIIKRVKEYVLSNWTLSDLHGICHWENVARNGMMLSKYTGANPFVIQLFAYLHDSCRINDGADIEHGVRASELVGKLKDSLLKDLTAKEYEQLCLSCRYHTTKLRLDDETIDTCFDADRLDLTRLGITLNPNRMATKQGARLAMGYPIRG